MKKKRILCALAATAVLFGSSFAGCSLVSSNSAADMEQVIAEVDISAEQNVDGADKAIIDNFKTAVGKTEVLKRDLVAYYLNVGYSYVQSGYSYSQVFNMLVDGLVENAVLTEYATMYLLNEKIGTGTASQVLEKYNSFKTEEEKLEYVLRDETADDPDKEIKIAEYGLRSMINSAIDSYEEQLLSEDETEGGSDSRALPSGVDEEKEDYFPADENGNLDYNVYTGYAGYLLKDSGAYKESALDNTTKYTRVKAYNNFMSTLINNALVNPETDDLKDILHGVSYIREEYISQLKSRIIDRYYDVYEQKQEESFTDGGEYSYLQAVYDDLYSVQTVDNSSATSFKSSMDNISDTSFALYSPDTEGEGTFGFVYNILLPFDAEQTLILNQYKKDYADEDVDGAYKPAYYAARRELISKVVTTDQREPWFTGETDYSFNAADENYGDYFGKDAQRDYLFFKNNLQNTDRYASIEKYVGKYSYNGKVYPLGDGRYAFRPNKLNIDDMLNEFVAYVNYVLGDDTAASWTPNEKYNTVDFNTDDFYTEATRGEAAKKDREIDYSNFVYASGKVNFGEVTRYKEDLFKEGTRQNLALSAVNELQYAYTTDTAVLSNYMGYSVSLGNTTGFIKEFEEACHEAIEGGAGSFNVCAGDYGWHLIYVTYTFDNPGGATYTPDWKNNVKEEGTFENLFYEWVKSNDIEEISTTRRTQIITVFNTESTVVKYESRYADLLALDNSGN